MKITPDMFWVFQTWVMKQCEDASHSEQLPDKNPADLEPALCVFTVCQAAVLSVQSGGTTRALQPARGMKMPQHVTTDSLVGQRLRHGAAHVLLAPTLPSCLSDVAEFVLVWSIESQTAMQVLEENLNW